MQRKLKCDCSTGLQNNVYDCCPYTYSDKLVLGKNTGFSGMNNSCSISDFLLLKHPRIRQTLMFGLLIRAKADLVSIRVDIRAGERKKRMSLPR